MDQNTIKNELVNKRVQPRNKIKKLKKNLKIILKKLSYPYIIA